jgi:3-phosphoshikimate 1-carboxyvinyltransferase
MGARITRRDPRTEGGEPVADLLVESSELTSIDVDGDLVPLIIDELPVLAVAACFASGTTNVRDAQELRVKESDRIATTVRELSALGARIEERPDGMVVHGTGRLTGHASQSHGDHRLAMALAVAGLVAEGDTVVEGAEAVDVSYPQFWEHLRGLRGEAEILAPPVETAP